MYKKLICIILGLNLFSIVFVEANLFAEMPAPYYNFGKSYVSDFEHIKLITNNPNQACVLFYSVNTESENVLMVEKNVEQSEIPNTFGEKTPVKKGCFYASLSPAVLPGISLGYGWTESDSSSYIKENIVVLHINTIGLVSTAGISISINSFKNLYRKGFFATANLGLDSVMGVGFSILFPNVTLGGGYSFTIGKDSFFRISLDLGIKVLISNLNLSIIF